ncbi:LacI family DNA-binding transcriptional regulator [Promicromonospora panici]|uniref:LacI family DNA-binding transcriptional regulator n=1 Tax=Promicromonospora panici TaxID=2219658 RepID=UPI0013EB4EEF|nr:LacI family DNA-binding transcriptional regulator [Promicromonospora panici]
MNRDIEKAATDVGQQPVAIGRQGAVTIYDVARHAGVSPSTVSRALGKPGRISARTERRIQDAAAELGYRANPMARALPTGRTQTLGLIVTDFTNPVYFDLVRGAERAAAEAGYTMVLAESQESGAAESNAVERVRPLVDGFVLAAPRLDDEALTAIAQDTSLVLVNRAVTGIASVVVDVRTGLSAALDHLRAHGHSSIGYLSGPARSWINARRWEVLMEEAPRRGMHIVEIPTTEPTLVGGRDALPRVRAAGVSALVAYNDLIAIGLLREAQATGLDVPGDLSIVGFDDIFGAELVTPELSTIRVPLGALGEAAIRVLIGRVDPETHEPAKAEFVPRQSTGPARSR